MADTKTITKDVEDKIKRKRSEISSTSELEFSTIEEKNSKKQKKKKPKPNKNPVNNDENAGSETESNENSDLIKQIKMINSKLEVLDGSMKKVTEKLGNIMVKGDGSLREVMKDLLLEMKDTFLKSVVKSIEIVESKLFDKEQENDVLKQKVEHLEEKVKENENVNINMREKLNEGQESRKKYENEAEQYSRRNNIKISGMLDDNKSETPFETAGKVINLIRRRNICNLHLHDIDIAHRLPNTINNSRMIIVKLHSRYAKDMILRNAKKLKGTGIFINEDLTRTNLYTLMCMKRKSPDEVQNAWSRNGSLYYKDKQDHVVFVPFEEYQDWIDLPWPQRNTDKKEKENIKDNAVNVD